MESIVKYNGSRVREVLGIIMVNLYTKFYFNTYNTCKENELKMQISKILLSPKGITVENCFIVLKIKLALDIFKIIVYTVDS